MNSLAGKRVVDVTRLLPGGYCSMILSDLGADVIKVEEPGLGDYMRLTPPMKGGVSLVHDMVNRGKESLALNLKTSEGKKILNRLLRDCDVFLEGFRPGAIEKLGFSFAAVRKINPEIVYCSISAFGHDSPLSSIPGHDINFQGFAGILDPTDEHPPLVQFADLCSGMNAAVGILAALCNPKRQAIFIDIPIVQSLLSWLILPASQYFTTGTSPRDSPSLAFGSESYYNLYGTADKKLMAVAAIEREFWQNLTRKLGVREFANLRRGTLIQRRRLKDKLGQAFLRKTRDEWSRILMMNETCATPVLTIAEALESNWARSSHAVRRISSGKRILSSPLRFQRSFRRWGRAPSLGQHTRKILSRIGYSRSQVDSMIREGVVSVGGEDGGKELSFGRIFC